METTILYGNGVNLLGGGKSWEQILKDISEGGKHTMKHGIKPSREQRKFIEKCGYNSTEYLVIKDTPNEMQIVARNGDSSVLTLHKN